MNLGNAISIGFKEIWAHKFRSLLTMLGIILGVSSLVGMSALVKGMENGMKDALIAIGGLEKVRIEEQEIPPQQLHLADQAVGNTRASRNENGVGWRRTRGRRSKPVPRAAEVGAAGAAAATSID